MCVEGYVHVNSGNHTVKKASYPLELAIQVVRELPCNCAVI